MRYQPVKIVRVTAVQYEKLRPGQTVIPRSDGIPSTVRKRDGLYGLTGTEKSFWRAQSNLLGDCGHKHKTEAAAQPCLERMQKQWSAQRSRQGKRAQRMQRETKRAAQELLGQLLYDAERKVLKNEEA